jgi:hypothetical protein
MYQLSPLIEKTSYTDVNLELHIANYVKLEGLFWRASPKMVSPVNPKPVKLKNWLYPASSSF